MYKILISTDDESRATLRRHAEYEGYNVVEALDGHTAAELAKASEFDMLILDTMTTKIDGFSVCKEIRKVSNLPVLFLSESSGEIDKLYAFEMGADDYVVKPFSPKEVMARVNAIIWRCSGERKFLEQAREIAFYAFGGLEVNIPAHEVKVDGVKKNLTPKEYDLLFYMVRNKNVALSRKKLLSDVWGYDFFGDDRTVDTHVKMLRNTLGVYRNFIVTLRGLGYKFIVEE